LPGKFVSRAQLGGIVLNSTELSKVLLDSASLVENDSRINAYFFEPSSFELPSVLGGTILRVVSFNIGGLGNTVAERTGTFRILKLTKDQQNLANYPYSTIPEQTWATKHSSVSVEFDLPYYIPMGRLVYTTQPLISGKGIYYSWVTQENVVPALLVGDSHTTWKIPKALQYAQVARKDEMYSVSIDSTFTENPTIIEA
jgi:hypothetical protein